MSRGTIDLVRPLARRTVVAATVAAVLFALSAPLALYARTSRVAQQLADDSAQRMALLARDVVIQLPDLWHYAAPKFVRHLHLRHEHPLVAHVAIVDTDGRRLDVPGGGELPPFLVWAHAPVHRGGSVVAQVWVAVDGTRMIVQLLIVTLVSLVLGATLSTVLYVLPVRVVADAEERIVSLVGKLDGTRAKLVELNAELEDRVAMRSRELAEAVDALMASEGELRKMAAREAEATEEERLRVARELHDGAGQILTAIRLSLQVLGADLGADDKARGRLEEAEALVDEAIVEVRRIAMALRPAALDRLGFVESLEELTRSVSARSGLVIDFEATSLDERLPAAVESAAYRVVQECLTNLVRYAEAGRATVAVALDDEGLRLRVHDDGRGFEPGEAEGKGLGIQGMRERVALLGGTLVVESGRGDGTTIQAVVPIDDTSGPGTEDEVQA